MRVYEDKIYTVKQGDALGEDVFRMGENIVLVIPKEKYQICYDVTSVNRVTTTLKISWENTDELYLVIPSIEKDEILEKYHLDAGYAYFILHFIHEELVDFGGIRKDTLETYYFQKSDFETKNQEKLSILQAPLITIYASGLFAKGLQELGCRAEYMINVLDECGHYLETTPDFNLDISGNTTEVCRARTLEFMFYALKNYDIMHFHTNMSLLLGGDRLWLRNADVGYLKKMGKKIVFSAWGVCDNTIGNEYDKWNWKSECNICKANKPLLCENPQYCKSIEITRCYSDAMVTNGRGTIAYSSMKWIDNPVDIETYRPEIICNIPKEFRVPDNGKLKIYHSFANAENREDVKGSGIIKGVVEKLQREGYDIEFIYFHNTEHKNIKYYQIQADIIIDQLLAGWHGSTGTEALALGKVMITYVNPDVKKYVEQELKREIPFLSASSETLYDVLKELIENEEKRKELGRKAREYAVKYHDYRVVASELIKIYKEL